MDPCFPGWYEVGHSPSLASSWGRQITDFKYALVTHLRILDGYDSDGPWIWPIGQDRDYFPTKDKKFNEAVVDQAREGMATRAGQIHIWRFSFFQSEDDEIQRYIIQVARIYRVDKVCFLFHVTCVEEYLYPI